MYDANEIFSSSYKEKYGEVFVLFTVCINLEVGRKAASWETLAFYAAQETKGAFKHAVMFCHLLTRGQGACTLCVAFHKMNVISQPLHLLCHK